MAIVRMVPLKDATAAASAQTSCGQGTVYDIGGIQPGKRIYAALHILSSSTGALKVRILSNSSSGASVGTTRFSFTCNASRSAEWLTPLTTGTTTATEQRFWRATWEMTTSGESYRFLPLLGIQ